MNLELNSPTTNGIYGFKGEYRYLSNFYPCRVTYIDLVYPSSENAYQASKLLNHSDRVEIVNYTPAESKIIWKTKELRYSAEKFDSLKIDIMTIIVFNKFSQNSNLRKQLIDTGNKYLEETNTWNDTFWGVCNNRGYNNLGKILMKVRSIV